MYNLAMDASQRLSELVDVLRRDGRVDVAAAAAEFGRQLGGGRALDIGDDNAGPVGGQPPHGALADPAGPAGDQGHLARQLA